MDAAALDQLLDDVRCGRVTPDEAAARLRHLPFTDLGFARVDHHRALRQGRAEAVYSPGKTPEQCAAIVRELLRHDSSSPVLLTRADDAQAHAARAENAGGIQTGTTIAWRVCAPRPEHVAVITAGTADLPVADECGATLDAHGVHVERLTDVGVAGLHRLLASMDVILDADVVIVVAGMEGALASVVGGLTAAPVIAVPTSVGYGAGLEGVTALLGMLASCASGMTVVGIDNGFGAACAAMRLFGPHPAGLTRPAVTRPGVVERVRGG